MLGRINLGLRRPPSSEAETPFPNDLHLTIHFPQKKKKTDHTWCCRFATALHVHVLTNRPHYLPFEQEPPRGSADVLHMDAQRDTKPFVSPITATGAIQRRLHGPSASQPTPALPSEHGAGARVLAGLQPQAQSHQAACVLNRAASELSGGVGGRGRASGTGEALEGTSARSPCLAPRLSRKFWSAGDYDAAATGSAPQPPSMSQC